MSTTGPTFEEYLASKRIDSDRFKGAEPDVWNVWKKEFDQLHPNSFTVQKLNLINPIRRKYLLKEVAQAPVAEKAPPTAAAPVAPAAKPGKPVMKPRPKMGGATPPATP